MSECVEILNRCAECFSAFAWPMLLQSSLLITVIFAFDLMCARRIRASVRYALWMVVLVKLLLPPALALPTGATWWLWRPHPVVETPSVQNYTVSYGNSMPEVSVPPVTVPAVVPPPKLNNDAWVLLTMLAMAAGLLSWLAFRWLSVAAKVRRAATAPELAGILQESRQLAGLRQRLRLRLIDDRQSPAVYGLFRPVILLPRTLANQLSSRQLRAVLLHEAMHLRRGDVWINFAQTLLQIAYWWHPLLWLANARIRRVREEAVDDSVMHALRGGADTYAPTLLEVAKFAFRRPLASLGLIGILESRSALRQRVERLVDFQPTRRTGLTLLSLCGIFAFSAVALPMGQGPATDDPTVSPSASQTAPPINTNDSPASGSFENGSSAFTKALALRSNDPPLAQALASEHKNAHWYITLTSQSNAPSGRLLSLPGALKSTRLDQFGPFQQVSFSVAIDKLSMKVPYLPILSTSKLLNGSQTMIDLPEMTNAPLSDVLEAIVKGANPPIRYSLMDRYIVFFPFPQPANLNDELFDPITGTKVFVPSGEVSGNYRAALDIEPGAGATNIVYTSPMRDAIYRKMNGLHLDEVSYQDLPLSEVLRQLRHESIRLDPDRQGINFLFNPNVESTPINSNISSAPIAIDPNTGLPEKKDAASGPADPTQINITLRLKNVALDDVLNAICSVSDHPIKYSVQDYGIVFSAKDTNGPQFIIGTFRVEPATVFSNLTAKVAKDVAPGDRRNINALARAFFAKQGVNLDPPKTLFFNDKRGVLFVYATPQDLDVIQKAILDLHVDPPQIHIKARFIEVPKTFFSSAAAGSLSPGLTNGGILTAAERKKVLQLLESQKGSEELAEPEGVTITGHQMQMRATIIQPIITNFTLEASAGAIVPQTTQAETGSIVDVFPDFLSDGCTMHLRGDAVQINFWGYDSPKGLVPNVATNDVGTGVLPVFQTIEVSYDKILRDDQTLVLFPEAGASSVEVSDERVKKRISKAVEQAKEKKGDKVEIVLVTATLIDAVGNRIHSDYYDYPDPLKPVPGTRNQIP